MNVTPFYLFIGIILLSVFAFFKPLHVQIEAPKELAQIELNDFIVHEIIPGVLKPFLAVPMPNGSKTAMSSMTST